jgi:hypothetical protein
MSLSSEVYLLGVWFLLGRCDTSCHKNPKPFYQTETEVLMQELVKLKEFDSRIQFQIINKITK